MKIFSAIWWSPGVWVIFSMTIEKLSEIRWKVLWFPAGRMRYNQIFHEYCFEFSKYEWLSMRKYELVGGILKTEIYQWFFFAAEKQKLLIFFCEKTIINLKYHMNVRWSCALKVNNSTPSIFSKIFSWLLQKTALLLYLPSIKRQFLLKKCPLYSQW